VTASLASGTVSVLIVRALVMGGVALGLAPRELLREAGFPTSARARGPRRSDARVAATWVLRLWDYLPRRAGDESFGLWLAERLSGAPLTVAW
jgi:hypothetical protein